MFSRRTIRFPQTLVMRLAIWFAILFVFSSVGGFLFMYVAFGQRLREFRDRSLLSGLTVYRRLYASQGLDAVKARLLDTVRSEGADDIFFRILDASGKELAASDLSNWRPVKSLSRIPDFNSAGDFSFQSLELPSQNFAARILYAPLAQGVILERGGSVQDYHMTMSQLWKEFLISLSLRVALGVMIAVLLARHVMAGVRAVTETAAAISRGHLNQRVPLSGRGDELDRLAETFNTMLDQIQALLAGLKEITDDIAHDLRSPISLIRGLAERFALSAHDGSPASGMDDQKQLSGTIVEACDKLLNLINTMLDISEMNSGTAKLSPTEFDLAGMARDTCELFQPLAEEMDISLEMAECVSAPFWGDERKIHRALANLIDNALKYTAPGGHVSVSLVQHDGPMRLRVNDDGAGIPPKDLDRIFERFYRPDRSRSQPGNGLGLSLAMAIAKAHRGTILVESAIGKGSSFSIVLPCIKPEE